MRCLSVLLLIGFLLIWTGSRSTAADYFLTIGGGPNPQSNQISLERNVLFQQRTLQRIRPDQPPHAIFFADGRSPQRDLQFRDESLEISAAQSWMTRLFGSSDSLGIQYRSSDIPGVQGPARLAFLEQHFQQLARKLQAGDRLIIYVSGHGGSAQEHEFSFGFDDDSSSEVNEFNTSIALWNDEERRVKEFCDWLDRLRPDVEVVLVMVQCYSGGFGHAIFHQGDARLGLNSRPRCGFFAQRHDRPAAGCTPEIDEVDYQEYSSFFWAALGGQSRTGEALEGIDYDGDGQVSLAEAHAYAVLASDTIDIPVRTSDYFLRRYSRIGPRMDAAAVPASSEPTDAAPSSTFFMRLGQALAGEVPEDAAATGSGKAEVVDGLLTLATPIERAMEIARLDRRAIVEQLCTELKINPRKPVSAVRSKLKKAEEKEVEMEGVLQAAIGLQSAQTALSEAVRAEWPELVELEYAPIVSQLTGELAEQFTQLIEQHPQAEAWRTADAQRQKVTEKQLKLAKREAKIHRLYWQLRSILLEANLAQVAPAEITARYQQLLRQEEQTLAIAATP